MATRHPKTGQTWEQQQQLRRQELAYGRRWLSDLILQQINRETQQRNLQQPATQRSLLHTRTH